MTAPTACTAAAAASINGFGHADADSGTANRLRLTYVSAAGEEGYPGELTAHVTYSLGEDDSLEIDLRGDDDRAHSGEPRQSRLLQPHRGSAVKPFSNTGFESTPRRFTPVDATLIPTGEARMVAGTPFDFRRATRIGRRIDARDEQLQFGHGYDHNWVLAPAPGRGGLRLAAVLADPRSGRVWKSAPRNPVCSSIRATS